MIKLGEIQHMATGMRNTQSIYNDKTGFINRVQTMFLRLRYVFVLRYDSDKTIILEDIVKAITAITKLVYANRKAAEGQGLDPLAQQTKKIIDYLIQAKENQLTRTELLVRGYGHFDSSTLDRITDTLMEMKWVKRERVGIGKNSDWLYHLAGEPLDSYNRFKAAQQNGHK
jgi:hypothetical protein